MRRKNPVRIGTIIEEIKKENNTFSDGMKEIAVMSAWQEAVGQKLADSTVKLFIRNRKLYVNLSSAVARSEMFARRKEILLRLNEAAGENYITFISIS